MKRILLARTSRIKHDASLEKGGAAKALSRLFASVLENEQISGSEKSDVSELADLVGEVTQRLPMISILKILPAVPLM